MKKLFILLLLSLHCFCFAQKCTKTNIDFGRYTYEGCDTIDIVFPVVKVCSEDIQNYLEQEVWLPSDTFEQLKSYCSNPYTHVKLNIKNNFDDFSILFKRTELCTPYSQYCEHLRNAKLHTGYLELTKNPKLIKTFRKIKLNQTVELCKITSTNLESSIPLGPVFIKETFPEEVNISLLCRKEDYNKIKCSLKNNNGEEIDGIILKASIDNFDILNKYITKEAEKKSAELEKTIKLIKKECPDLYHKISIEPYNRNAINRFQELACDLYHDFW